MSKKDCCHENLSRLHDGVGEWCDIWVCGECDTTFTVTPRQTLVVEVDEYEPWDGDVNSPRHPYRGDLRR